jgi:hypothetical protein
MGSQSILEFFLAAEDGKELDTTSVAQSLFRRTVVDFNDLDINVQSQK